MRVVLILALLSTSLSAQSRLGPTDGVAAIRRQRSGVDVRWENKVGRALSELAILATAREHDQPYEWSLHEMEAVAVGLDPAVIDAVRNEKPLTSIGEKEAAIIQLARDIGRHKVGADIYARALKTFGQSNLVDVVSLMGQSRGDGYAALGIQSTDATGVETVPPSALHSARRHSPRLAKPASRHPHSCTAPCDAAAAL